MTLWKQLEYMLAGVQCKAAYGSDQLAPGRDGGCGTPHARSLKLVRQGGPHPAVTSHKPPGTMLKHD